MHARTLQVLGALRRMTQALDTHSKKLEQTAGLTVPQVLVLEALRPETGPLSAGPLAGRVSLSQGTVTSILDRLESKGLIRRVRDRADRRKVLVSLTAAGRKGLAAAPPLLQTHFVQNFEGLPAAQQQRLVDAFEQVAGLMRAPESTELPITPAA